jgi:hypothetical protein
MPPLSSSYDSSKDWRDLYRAAILELDQSKIRQNIVDAERAILERARELFHQGGDNGEETENLNDAMYALRALRSTLKYHSTSSAENTRPSEAA